MSSRQHRKFIVLSGDPDWCRSVLGGLPTEPAATWITEQAPAGVTAIPAARAAKLLGGELDVLVFDAHAGFNPDAMGVAAGVVRGGGAFILLTPRLEEWTDLVDPESKRIRSHGYQQHLGQSRFLTRLKGLLRSAEEVRLFEQGTASEAAASVVRGLVGKVGDVTRGTEDQQRAIDAIVRVATGHRRRPLVMVADRGRGKSAALGIAAAKLILGGRQRVLVTAPRLDAAAALFDHASRLLPGSQCSGSTIVHAGRTIAFVAPDELLSHPREADLVLVDEAAAIPAPLLESLLRRHARIAFATTVHGYEGTGRGFAVRFRNVLDQVTPQWREIRLQEPVRWAPGDPLEKFTFRALLLDADPAQDEQVSGAKADSIVIERLARDRLLQNDTLLSQVFGLLVSAHYRTTPLDLRNLLDGPNISVWIAGYADQVVAAALVAREGGFDAALAEQVWMGFRRPRGHLLPETLAAHVGLKQAPLLQFDRIIRIAVHPVVRSRGIGHALLQRIAAAALEEGRDAVGVSFGATARLIKFWRDSGFESLRLGVTREARSGVHSVLMLRPQSTAATELCDAAHSRFLQQFPLLLAGPLNELDADIAIALLQAMPAGLLPILSDTDLQDLYTFSEGTRDYTDIIAPLRTMTLLAAAGGNLDREGLRLLLYRVLQHRDWGSIAELSGRSGRKELLLLLRQLVVSYLSSLEYRASIR